MRYERSSPAQRLEARQVLNGEASTLSSDSGQPVDVDRPRSAGVELERTDVPQLLDQPHEVPRFRDWHRLTKPSKPALANWPGADRKEALEPPDLVLDEVGRRSPEGLPFRAQTRLGA